ncbi:MAG TPA: hypothetical protein VG871_20960 [Vicinamibacterales bacterium]|nr:hypothetical protein [Vicinamibacterales bacterium]
MTARGLRSAGMLTVAVIAGGLLLSASLTAQSSAAAPPLVITAYGGQPPKTPYIAPKTPWGEPDLQGVWSSDDTDGIPMNRQAQYGNQLYLNDQEYAQRVQRTNQGVERGENAISSFRFDFGRRAFRQTSLIVDPPDGRMPAYTAEGMKRPMPRGTYGNGPLNWTTDFSLYERCITRGIVGSSVRVIYGNGQRIVQSPGVVALTYEMVHDTRVIYTDGRPHIGQKIRQYLGDSRAHWDGDELVVETTNLTDQTAIGLNGNGNRDSEKMVMTERFKRVANDVVQYQVTIDDPVTYTRPFTLSYPLTPLDGGEILPYDCHEGNQALYDALGAERAEDKRIAEERAKGIDSPRRPVQGGLGVGGQPVGQPGPGGLNLDGPRGGGPGR